MSHFLKNTWNSLWGRGDHSVTVPTMDGALRPNMDLDEADTVLKAEGIDNLVLHAGNLYFSQGKQLLTLNGPAAEPMVITEYSSDIAAIAFGASGQVAVALDEGKLLIGASLDAVNLDAPVSFGGRKAYVTALAFNSKGVLLICIGSDANKASEWKRDLMLSRASGSVWSLESEGATPKLLDDKLAFPSGICFMVDGAPVIAEAWKHRLLRKVPSGWQTVLEDLPGYPGRLAAGSDGCLWLCVFAPRSQMIEFVLREGLYRQRMVERIDEQYWISPTLRAGKSFKEPLQGGGVRHLGIQKPWGPTRSYGLAVKLDPAGLPIASHHSRSDGHRHGVTSVVDWNGMTYFASKGDGALVSLKTDSDGADAA